MADNHNSTPAVLLALLAGGLIGAGLALLFAPASGAETRRRIRETTEDVRDRAEDFIADSRDRIENFVDESRERITGLVEQGREGLESATAGLRGIIEEGRRAYKQRRHELESDSSLPSAAPSDEGAVS